MFKTAEAVLHRYIAVRESVRKGLFCWLLSQILVTFMTVQAALHRCFAVRESVRM